MDCTGEEEGRWDSKVGWEFVEADIGHTAGGIDTGDIVGIVDIAELVG